MLEKSRNTDPEIAETIDKELIRQRESINLTASENFASEAVMAACGTVLIITSGIRLGTPAVTTKGMKEQEMGIIAKLISEVLNDIDNQMIKKKVKEQTIALCTEFPLYQS